MFKIFFRNLGSKRSFIKSVSTYSIASIIEKAIPILLLPILTRLLTTFDYGIITTVNAVRGALDPILSLSTPGAVGRAYFDRDKQEFDFSCYIYNALLLNTALLFLACFLFLPFYSLIPGIEKVGIFWLLFIIFYVWSSATGGIKVKLWVYQQRPTQYGLFNVLKALANVLFSIALVMFFLRTWESRILGIGLTEIGFSLVSLFFLFRDDGLNFKINWAYIKDTLKFGLPLILHSVGMIVVTTADKFFLNALVGVAATGVYGIGYLIGSSLVFLAAPIDMAAEPVIYSKLGQGEPSGLGRLVILCYLYFLALILLAVAMWLLAPIILRILVDEKFHGAGEYVLWIAFGYAAFGMRRMLSKFITYSKKTYLLSFVTVITAIVSVISNWILIRLNGPIGAAQATFVSFTVNFLLTWLIAMKLYHLPWFRSLIPAR